MTTLKKYDLSGKELGEIDAGECFEGVEANSQMIKDYIVALRRNARQWSASTKGRSEVSHSNQKPHRQKGTGNARQGTLAAPQYRGGGVVFGPKPKFNQHVRINAKERRSALRFLLAEKMKFGHVLLIDDSAAQAGLKDGKTKVVANFLKSFKIFGRKVLFVSEGTRATLEEGNETIEISVRSDKHQNLHRSTKNIPRAECTLASNLNGYEVMAARDIILTESAFAEIKNLLSKKSAKKS